MQQDTFSLVMSYMPLMLQGLLTTIQVSLEAAVIGELFGLLLALLRRGKSKVINGIIGVYISFVRGTPLLVQIFVIYYAVSMLGLNLPAAVTGVIALSLNSGGFVAEILRGGFSAIPRGQYESGYALGMSKGMVTRRIVLPQVIKIVLPQFITEVINVIKVSPLLSVITVVDLTRVAQRLVQQTNVCIPFYATIAVFYFILCAALEGVVNAVSKKLNKSLSVG